MIVCVLVSVCVYVCIFVLTRRGWGKDNILIKGLYLVLIYSFPWN